MHNNIIVASYGVGELWKVPQSSGNLVRVRARVRVANHFVSSFVGKVRVGSLTDHLRGTTLTRRQPYS